MALPGKRHPRSLTRKRRSAWMSAFKKASLTKCTKCGTPKRPHMVCQVCGTYKGVKVLDIKHRITRSERRAAQKAALAKEKAASKKEAGKVTKKDIEKKK